ncbi:MAG: M28 family peptidase [Ignavibacteriales bacterium]|nr:M28 family peptidase [Ignavibacteriales bacterium]
MNHKDKSPFPTSLLFPNICVSRYVLFVVQSFLFVSFAFSQQRRLPEITASEVYEHIKYLASDELEGRKSGSKGAQLAAKYLEKEFKSYGLKPLGDQGTFFQKFDFLAGVKLGAKNSFAYRVSGKQNQLKLDDEFRPLSFSSSGSYSGEVVFAGYGISAPDQKYDDYHGVQVKDKAVIVMRNSPAGDTPHNEFTAFTSLRYKVSKAKELGAKAILIVTGPLDSDEDKLMRLAFDQTSGGAGIPAINLTRAATERILQSSLSDLQKEINQKKTPGSFVVKGASLSLEADVLETREVTENVVGFLEGNDAKLKEEVLVIGAHYDHLGYGGEGSGSLKPDTVAIHNGADDNASGTAGLLELAQFFASKKNDLKRSMLFIAFSGEELGLLGSAYYMKNPTMPIERMIAMVNMDEIGRLKDRKLIVYGMGTSPGFESLVTKYNKDSTFDLNLQKDGFGPSDHSSFYAKKIPVFHFFTDIHPDYHRPSDDYDKINSQGAKQILDLIANISTELLSAEARPLYAQVEAPRQPAGGGRDGMRTYTGTIPDFGEQAEGMKLAGVREGSPAAKAGLQAGDIIVKFGKVDIKNLYDYTYALGEYKPGDEVDVVVIRGKEKLSMKVKLERRN